MTFDVAVQAQGLSRSFGEEHAVEDLSLQVGSGEIHAIVGLNGAGKTTLMRLLLGMLTPDSGTALVLGMSAQTAGPATWSRVGHLIENPFSYPELTVAENLWASMTLSGGDTPLGSPLIKEVLDQFELSHWADRRSGTLSLGNKQRLGLASAIVHHPDVLVLDEPANALDPAGVVFIRNLLRARADEGAAVLVSSHHLDEIARVADRISVLHRGRVVGSLDQGTPDLERQFFDLIYEVDRLDGRIHT